MIATHRPINLANAFWTENGLRATFAASRPGFGVQCIATGEVLSRDGVTPSAWNAKAAADIIAQYPPDYPTVAITKGK